MSTSCPKKRDQITQNKNFLQQNTWPKEKTTEHGKPNNETESKTTTRGHRGVQKAEEIDKTKASSSNNAKRTDSKGARGSRTVG